MPSSHSASSPLTQILAWCLYPWFFSHPPDQGPLLGEDTILGGDLQIHEPNSPPAQMVGMPFQIAPLPMPAAQTLPSEISAHIGQFLTNDQYANLVHLNILTPSQQSMYIDRLSDRQLAILLNRNILNIDQICGIGYRHLITIMSGRNITVSGLPLNVFTTLANTNTEVVNQFAIGHALKRNSIFTLEQKTLLLKLNFMSQNVTRAFMKTLCTDNDVVALILEDSLTQAQLNSIGYRLSYLGTEVIFHLINSEIDNSVLFERVNFLAGGSQYEVRDIQILITSLTRAIETGRWSYYLQPVSHFPNNSINSVAKALSTLGPGGIYFLTAIYLNEPQETGQLRNWSNFIEEIYRNNQIINTVALEAYSQWVNTIVNTRGHHPLFNINVLSDERFSLINMSYFLYEIPIETNILMVTGRYGVKNYQKKITYGVNALVDLMHDFPSNVYDPYGFNFVTHLREAFNQISQLSRGRRDVLREFYKQLDWDKKALFVACTGYNPFTDDGHSLDSGGAGSSNDPPRPPGSSNDPAPPHGGETRRLEQATPVLTPGLNYFGKELTLQPSEVKASVATKANLLPYDLVHNRLLNGNDHHWYRITLSKGSIYNFNMVKEGVSNLDANLVLRDTSGAVVATDTGLGGGHTQFLSVAGGRNALISFIAPYSGDYYLDASSAGVYVNSPNDMGNPSVGDFHGTGGYRLSSALVQKMALDVGAQAVDLIEVNTDRDWYQIHLNRGERYHFKLEHNPQDGLQPLLCLRDAQGNAILTSDSNGEFQFAPFASIDFTAVESGDYFLDVGSSHAASTGQYRLSSSRDDVLAVTTTRAKIVVGETIRGTLENNQDHDWYKVDLKAGITYKFFLKHVNNTDHLDPWLNLRDTNGKIIKSDDDSAGDLNSLIQFKATHNATYFLDAGSYHDQSRGQFSLSSVSVL